jgi:ABC-type Na+ efflux pump permease subunit
MYTSGDVPSSPVGATVSTAAGVIGAGSTGHVGSPCGAVVVTPASRASAERTSSPGTVAPATLDVPTVSRSGIAVATGATIASDTSAAMMLQVMRVMLALLFSGPVGEPPWIDARTLRLRACSTLAIR